MASAVRRVEQRVVSRTCPSLPRQAGNLIFVAQTVWIGSTLILAGWLSWLTTRAKGDHDRIEDMVDRLDQVLHALQFATPAGPGPAVTPVERPAPAGGPPTVPTSKAIDAWQAHELAEGGRHARRD
jgi:hypothetical protein